MPLSASEGPAETVCALRRHLNASWTMCWTAGEYEIGNWDYLRLRQLASARNRQERMRTETIEPIGSDLS